MNPHLAAEALTADEFEAIARILAVAANRRAVEIAAKAPTVLDLGARARFSVEETASMLGLSSQAVRNRIACGEITAVRDGRAFRVTRAEIERLAGYRRAPTSVRLIHDRPANYES